MYGVRDSQLTRAILNSYAAEGVPLFTLGNCKNLVSVVSVENAALAHRLAARALVNPSRAKGKVAGEVFIVAEDPPIPFWHHMKTLWKGARGEAALQNVWRLPGWPLAAIAFVLEWVFYIFTLGHVRPLTVFSRTFVSYTLHSHTYNSSKIRRTLGFDGGASDHDRIVAEAVEWERKRKAGAENKQD